MAAPAEADALQKRLPSLARPLGFQKFNKYSARTVGVGRRVGARDLFCRHLLACLIGSAGWAGTAFAADLNPPPIASVGLPDWSGIYAGVIGGYHYGFANQTGIGPVFSSGDYTMNGGLAGGNLGFNYQFGRWVIGMDSEIDGAWISGSKAPFFSSNMDALFAVRARLGYSVGNFLPYVGLGPAYTHFSSSETFPGAPQISDNHIRSGWTFAAGADYMILPNLWARFEYMYICFGNDIVANSNNVELMGQYARFALDYKFDIPGLKREEVASDVAATGRSYNWSGVYVGPSVGGSAVAQTSLISLNNVPLATIHGRSAGGLVDFGLQGTIGAQAGANWQFGSYVFGVETDFHLSELSGGGTNITAFPHVGAVGGKYSQNNIIDEQGTLRVRFGVALDRWLIYATAGLAYGSYESSPSFTLPAQTISADFENTRIGPVWGLGVERAIWGQWTTRIEYMYADFGQQTYSLAGPAPLNLVSSKTAVRENILRVGFNRLFN